MDQDHHDEPAVLPFPLERIARLGPDIGDEEPQLGGEDPVILLFAQPHPPHPRPAA